MAASFSYHVTVWIRGCRWKEHFSELLNKDIRQDVSYEESPRKITESDPRIDIPPPTRNEVETALKEIKEAMNQNR
jgi:hypothetical protein